MCIYKIDPFALFIAQAWRKNGVEAIEYCGKIWINQGKLDPSNISDRTQYYSEEFKKMRCKIKECGNYQLFRVFIQNILALKSTMTAKKTQAAIFNATFGVNQHDLVLRRQQSSGLRLKIYFQTKT